MSRSQGSLGRGFLYRVPAVASRSCHPFSAARKPPIGPSASVTVIAYGITSVSAPPMFASLKSQSPAIHVLVLRPIVRVQHVKDLAGGAVAVSVAMGNRSDLVSLVERRRRRFVPRIRATTMLGSPAGFRGGNGAGRGLGGFSRSRKIPDGTPRQ